MNRIRQLLFLLLVSSSVILVTHAGKQKPFKSKCCITTGFAQDPLGNNIFYKMQGDCSPGKQAIIFLPPLDGIAEQWTCLQNLFCRKFCTVAIDMLGQGRSDKPTTLADYEMSNTTAGVIAVINKLGITNPVVIGNSVGSFVAQEVALTIPLSKLVLIGSSSQPGPLDAFGNPLGGSAVFFGTIATLQAEGKFAEAATFDTNNVFNEACTDNPAFNCLREKNIARLTAVFSNPVTNTPLTNYLIIGLNPPFGYNHTNAQLASITVPTLIMRGSIDQVIPNIDAAVNLRKNIPNSFLVELNGKGHEPQSTDVCTLYKIIKNFITGKDLQCQPCPFPQKASR